MKKEAARELLRFRDEVKELAEEGHDAYEDSERGHAQMNKDIITRDVFKRVLSRLDDIIITGMTE